MTCMSLKLQEQRGKASKLKEDERRTKELGVLQRSQENYYRQGEGKNATFLKSKELIEYRSEVGQLKCIAQHKYPDLGFGVINLNAAYQKSTTADIKKLINTVNKLNINKVTVRLNMVENEKCEYYTS